MQTTVDPAIWKKSNNAGKSQQVWQHLGTENRNNVSGNFFTQWVLNVWNSLPHNLLEAKLCWISRRNYVSPLGLKGSKGMGGRGIRIRWSTMIKMNGGTVSKGRTILLASIFPCRDSASWGMSSWLETLSFFSLDKCRHFPAFSILVLCIY